MLFYYKMTEREGLNTTEGIDVDHTDLGSSQQCDICHFCFFKKRNFNYLPYICDRCHDATLRVQAIRDVKISTIKSST